MIIKFYNNFIYNNISNTRSATRNGHFGVVKFLFENRIEGCSEGTLASACAHNRIDIVKYMIQNNLG
eukprot:Pgem_evm1s13032